MRFQLEVAKSTDAGNLALRIYQSPDFKDDGAADFIVEFLCMKTFESLPFRFNLKSGAIYSHASLSEFAHYASPDRPD